LVIFFFFFQKKKVNIFFSLKKIKAFSTIAKPRFDFPKAESFFYYLWNELYENRLWEKEIAFLIMRACEFEEGTNDESFFQIVQRYFEEQLYAYKILFLS